MDVPSTGSQSADAEDRRRSSAATAGSSGGRSVSIAGLSIGLLEEGPAAVRAAVDDLLAGLPAAGGDPDVELRWTEVPVRVPSGPPVASWPDLAVHRTETGTIAVGAVAATGSDGLVELHGDGADAHRVLPFALATALLARGRFLVHAALVVRGGRGLLAVGPTGSGKSTVAHAAAARSWSVRTDDLAVLRRDPDGAVLASGLPRGVRVPPDVGAEAGGTIEGDRRARRVVTVAEAGDEVPIAAVGLLQQSTSPDGGLGAADASDVLDVLVGSCFAASDAEGLRAWLPVAAAVANGPVGVIVLGADPARRADGAVAAMAELLERAHQ